MWRERRPGTDGISTALVATSLAIDGSSEPVQILAFLPQGIPIDLPQRLHKVCVLLWRLPKDEVPFAIWRSVAALLGLCQARSTHSSWAILSSASSQLRNGSELRRDIQTLALSM